jgi:TP901 family phage tail tape measure protein
VSDYLAEARVVIRPDTTLFRQQLVSELAVATRAVTVPIPVTPVVSGAGAASAAAAAQTVAASALAAQTATLGLASATQLQASAFGKQATLLTAVSDSALQAAGAQQVLARHTGTTTKALIGAGTATQTLNAGLLGLRTLVGSQAVIGLGALALSAIAAANALRSSIGSAAALERQLNIFQATTGATRLEMERVSAAAVRLGGDIRLPGVSAQDAAESISLLSRAGLSVEDSLAGAEGTLALAAAAMTDVGTASNITASALNSFGLAGSEASRVADLLTGAAIEAQGEITDMALALQQSAAVANLAGLGIEDTVTFITQLAQAGLRGSDAGTSLRVALIRLIAPTSAAAEQLRTLGIRVRDAEGDVRPEVFTDLAAALRGLDQVAQDQVLLKIFGTDALRAAAILGRDGPAAFNEVKEAATKTGLAQKVAEGQTKGLTGSFERLKNQAGIAATNLGSALTPALKGAADMATTLLGGLNSLNAALGFGPKTQEAAKGFQGLTADLGELREELARTKEEAGGFVSPVEQAEIERLEERIADLEKQLQGATVAAQGFGPPMVAVTQTMIDAAFAARDAGKEIEGLTASMIRGQLQAQNTAVARAQAFGETGLQELIAKRERIDRILEGADRPEGPALEGLLRDRKATTDAIVAIYEEAAADRRAAADDVQKALDAADQAFVDKVEAGGAKRANRLLVAQGTETLADDIAAQRSIRQFYKDRIAEVRRTVNDAKLAARLIAAFTKEVITAEQAITAAQKEQQGRRDEAAKERERAAEEARQRALARFDLDIELAEITENEAKEIRARRAKIKALQAQLALEAQAHGKNTLLYKQLRNEIAREKEAIDDLKGEQDDATSAARSFAQATFEFLQAQQGFAANLLGNLIPRAATAGLVGGSAAAPLVSPQGAETLNRPGVVPVDFGLRAQQGIAEARSQGGPTSGQAQTTNGLLSRILKELVDLNQADKTPEATRQKRRANAAMDGVGGG